MRFPIGAAIFVITLLASGGVLQAQGDAEQGEDVFRKCRACHDIGDGARNRVGPPLTNIVGRKAASVDGFPYSSDMKSLGAKGFMWNEENLDKYLENVRSVVANGKMVFPGLKDEQDRKDLIAYLKRFGK